MDVSLRVRKRTPSTSVVGGERSFACVWPFAASTSQSSSGPSDRARQRPCLDSARLRVHLLSMPYVPAEMSDEDPRAELISSMIEDLGWCLNSYGQVEYLIGDLIWQAWHLPAYQGLSAQVPMALEKRIRHLEKIFDVEGPLSPHAHDLRLLVERLRQLSQPRNMFAHGHCTFVFTKDGEAAMNFRRFLPPDSKGQVEKYLGQVRPQTLRVARQAWCRFASSAQRIIGAIYVDLSLERPDSGPVRSGGTAG